MQKDRFNFQYFSQFFLTISFPIHFWSLMMVFRDFESVASRTYSADAVGYAGYSLVFALAESLMVSLLFWGLSLVIARKLDRSKVLSILVGLFYLLAGANIVDMLAHINNQVRISRQYLHGLEQYPEITYSLIAGAILVGFVILLILILKPTKAAKFIAEVLERITMLGYLFLFLDLVGLIIVLIRNLG